jgi:hypothetical protein
VVNDPESVEAAGGDAEVKQESARRTRRSFLVAGLGAAGGYGLYRWIDRSRAKEMLPGPLRETLNFNGRLNHGIFDDLGLAPTYPVSKSVPLRVNGNYGLEKTLALDSYRLQVVGVRNAQALPGYVPDVTTWNYKYAAAPQSYTGHDTKVNPALEPKASAAAGTAPSPAAAMANTTGMNPAFAAAFSQAMQINTDGEPMRGQDEAGQSDSTLDSPTPGLLLPLADIVKLPHIEMVTQFKCIEGWSEIVHWGGVRLADFIEAYPPALNEKGRMPKYVYMETPEGNYYCGFELRDCMHPQSMLTTEMAGLPLTQEHGAPIRLHMPIKYGYKQIKRIALIAYTDEKPDDYWTRLGYDWYAGL